MDVVLCGADHRVLGVVASRALDADRAIALTRGLHPKAYSYVDPNEDAVAMHATAGGTSMFVADGHDGASASHIAVDVALPLRRPSSTVDAVVAVHRLNVQILQRSAGGRRRSRTTLAAAWVDGRDMRYLSVGDSTILLVRSGQRHVLTAARPHFLGAAMSEPGIAGAMEQGTADLVPDDVVLLVTDGFTNFAAVDDLPGIVAAGSDAEAIATGVIDHAGRAGAGDNVAVAVLRVPYDLVPVPPEPSVSKGAAL